MESLGFFLFGRLCGEGVREGRGGAEGRGWALKPAHIDSSIVMGWYLLVTFPLGMCLERGGAGEGGRGGRGGWKPAQADSSVTMA